MCVDMCTFWRVACFSDSCNSGNSGKRHATRLLHPPVNMYVCVCARVCEHAVAWVWQVAQIQLPHTVKRKHNVVCSRGASTKTHKQSHIYMQTVLQHVSMYVCVYVSMCVCVVCAYMRTRTCPALLMHCEFSCLPCALPLRPLIHFHLFNCSFFYNFSYLFLLLLFFLSVLQFSPFSSFEPHWRSISVFVDSYLASYSPTSYKRKIICAHTHLYGCVCH